MVEHAALDRETRVRFPVPQPKGEHNAHPSIS